MTVDSSLLWVGAVLAVVAAVLLAFVPRLPGSDASHGFGLSTGGVRITSGTNRRLRVFAVTQIAASFVLLAGAAMLLTTLLAPTYVVSGVVHYGVANMPALVPRTATFALTNATLPYVQQLADRGIDAIRDDPALAAGVNVWRGEIVHPAVAASLGETPTPLSVLLD